jgi:hypothetical protein
MAFFNSAMSLSIESYVLFEKQRLGVDEPNPDVLLPRLPVFLPRFFVFLFRLLVDLVRLLVSFFCLLEFVP